MVKKEDILGLIGSVVGLLVTGFVWVMSGMESAFLGTQELEIQVYITAFGSILGIIGSVYDSNLKNAGIIMCISGLFLLIGSGYFGIFSFILLIIGGIIKFRSNRVI